MASDSRSVVSFAARLKRAAAALVPYKLGTEANQRRKLLEAAREAHAQGRLDQAERGYRRILRSKPDSMTALAGRAEIAWAREDWAEAVSLWKRAEASAHLASRKVPVPFMLKHRDAHNRLRWGPAAPRAAERIWIKAREVRRGLAGRTILPDARWPFIGLVVEQAWPEDEARDVLSIPKIDYCIRHWRDGVPWAETGIYDYMMMMIERQGGAGFDGCFDRDDVIARYEQLDRIFAEVTREGRLKRAKEVGNTFRERGGVIFHIGPEAEPFFGFGGCHRFAIAHVLDLTIPAQLGIVHRDAIPHLERWRTPPE